MNRFTWRWILYCLNLQTSIVDAQHILPSVPIDIQFANWRFCKVENLKPTLSTIFIHLKPLNV